MTATEPKTARPALTPRQAEVLAAIVRLTGECGHPPTIRELCGALAILSPNGVASHLKLLAKKGYVETPLGGTSVPYRPGLGRAVARRVVVPELRAALQAAAAEYLRGLS